MKSHIILFSFVLLLILPAPINAAEKTTILIEVEGDIEHVVEHIETYHPFIEIKHTYSLIFNGLALEGKPKQLLEIEALEQVSAVHDVQTYQSTPHSKSEQQSELKSLYPQDIPYTGKGVNVAVIDTGIDYTHPDLQKNYQQGYDVFDMDDDPMETLAHEGIPTEHGTHVAGIIAADGELQGVAPDANIFAYRALGPGGFGTSVHILAALEQAVKDGADIINLSLGNNVNGPDYPTSTAVNKAVEMGVAVVIANGNSGPGLWTVGAPATAERAIAIGAAQDKTTEAQLYHRLERKTIPLRSVYGAPAWKLTKDYQITNMEEANFTNKIALIEQTTHPIEEIQLAQDKGAVGVIIIQYEEGGQQTLQFEAEKIAIPVAIVNSADGKWLVEQSKRDVYMETIHKAIDEKTADFSSRGPVTVNWQIKPDLIAPGTNIYSTIPGGYEAFSGTSMATPYISGVLALMKEAHPDWSPDKMYQALKTAAVPFDEERPLPTTQGHGFVQPKASIHPETIISNASLNYGKIKKENERSKLPIEIENNTEKQQQYHFRIPKKTNNYRFHLPLSFIVEPFDKITIDIELDVQTSLLEEGLHEGYVILSERNSGKDIYLPYLFVHQAADQPKTFGFELSLEPLSTETYKYQVYATEVLKEFTVNLYHPDTLTWVGELFHIENAQIGMNEGKIASDHISPGIYTAQIMAVTANGKEEIYELDLYLE